MSIHLIRDLGHIKKEILTLGALVEEAINKAITALLDRRPELAKEVIEGDRRIDEMEVQVEEACLKALALHQPVAADLRFIITVLKVNNDLERMGDHATDIAERVQIIAQTDGITIPEEFASMGDNVQAMVRESLDCLVQLNTGLAKKVTAADDVVDALHRQLFGMIEERILAQPETIKLQMSLLSATRHLERIADLATNIAEDVIFQVEGRVVRHAMDRYQKP